MTDPATLLALADRVEREAPSRELFVAMATALGWRRGVEGLCRISPKGIPHEREPNWLYSIDAAISLIPHGWVWVAGCDFEQPGFARIHWCGITADDRPLTVQSDGAATPAAALCAAALRALARESGA